MGKLLGLNDEAEPLSHVDLLRLRHPLEEPLDDGRHQIVLGVGQLVEGPPRTVKSSGQIGHGHARDDGIVDAVAALEPRRLAVATGPEQDEVVKEVGGAPIEVASQPMPRAKTTMITAVMMRKAACRVVVGILLRLSLSLDASFCPGGLNAS